MRKQYILKGGFALPTVLIASIVMLSVLAVSVSSVAAVRTSLKTQYYEQLAKEAGEAGVAYANACLSKNKNVPLWSDAKPLTPATDCAGNVLLSPTIQAVVVGGGGGGGANNGGGGGGGGVKVGTYTVSATTYAVTVGAGGAGASSDTTAGGAGGSSALGSLASVSGGGGGATRTSSTAYVAAGNGASGGGGTNTYVAANGTGTSGGTGIAGQGYAGGLGSSQSGGAGNGGGGGGAGAAGGNASGVALNTGVTGYGGIGIMSDISGQQVYYGGGGSGGGWGTGATPGVPGLTGGGAGALASAAAGAAGQPNTGGGGGGGAYTVGLGGAGGSGVVIIRYANNGSITPGTMTGTYTTYVSGPYKVYRFTTSGTFVVSAVSTSSCPSDPRCSVMVDSNNTFRSSFTVKSPTLDADGKALTIPNNGYVELLRASNGAVWRTYRQPSVQAAVVPDICSGAAGSSLGWSNAVVTTAQSVLPNAAQARSISLADSPLSAGYIYFRKDFTVTDAGSYNVSVVTPSTSSVADVYIDGAFMRSAQGQMSSGATSLAAGCHTIFVRLTNKTALSSKAHFTAAVQQSGSEPIIATDSSWRVSAGRTVHFSQSDYYADPSVWVPAHANNTVLDLRGAGWTTNDPLTMYVYPSCDSSCPGPSTTYLRAGNDISFTSDTDVTMVYACDDDCIIYIDGQPVAGSTYSYSTISQQSFTLTANVAHRIGIALYNTASGASGAGLTIFDKGNGKVYARTDASWYTSDAWVSGATTADDPLSYEASFTPSPMNMPKVPTYDVLVVGGGGGGASNTPTGGGAGGGGGGGVIYQTGVTATTGARTVTVGAGGAGGGGTTRINGTTGSSSVFGSLTAIGGGGGAAQTAIPGLTGGSGGGASGGGNPAPGGTSSGTAGQGNAGGAGFGSSAYNGGGGGGAGGFGVAGTATSAGNGGPALLFYMVAGKRFPVGGGGGGGTYGTTSTVGVAESLSGGNGGLYNTNGGIGVSGSLNRGGGGGGGAGSPHGAAGGAGGSGLVVVRFVKDSLSVSVSGGTFTQEETTINNVTYTVYTFTAGTSTFNITAVNQ